jgi:hypothetical protein
MIPVVISQAHPRIIQCTLHKRLKMGSVIASLSSNVAGCSVSRYSRQKMTKSRGIVLSDLCFFSELYTNEVRAAISLCSMDFPRCHCWKFLRSFWIVRSICIYLYILRNHRDPHFPKEPNDLYFGNENCLSARAITIR